jgi:branched-chain amino acid transport system substrate-binding protein
MQKRMSRIFTLALGMPLLLALLVACGAGTTGGSNSAGGSTNTGSTTIKVATDLPVSGADASIGKPTENGARLAVDEANHKHTIPNITLQLVANDDVGVGGVHDPNKGANNITSMIGDNLVAGVVGPFNSNVARAEMPIANNAPIALISPSNTNPCLTQNSAASGCSGSNDQTAVYRPTGKVTYFRVVTTDNLQGPAAADFLYQKQNYKKVYVIDDTETYGVGLAKYFIPEWQKLGGTVIDHKSVKSTNSYVGLLTEVASTHPDVIYFAGNFSTGGTLIRKEMQQVPGLQNVGFAGGDGIQDSSFATAVGTTGGPVYATVPAVDPAASPAAKDFISAYTAKYGTIGAYSAPAYEAMNVLIQGIKAALAKTSAPKDSGDSTQGKAFRQAVINGIQSLSYDGILGHTSFDSNGDTTNKNLTIYQVAEVNNQVGWKAIATQSVSA